MEATDFFVEDLLDLPNGDDVMNDAFLDSSYAAAGNSTDSSTVTAVDSCNSSVSGVDAANFSPANFPCRSFADAQFSGELCVPYDDMAELEWLSNFVEESFSSEDLHHHAAHTHQYHRLHLLSGSNAPSGLAPSHFRPESHHCSTNTRYHHAQPQYPPPPHLLRSETTVPGKARSKISRVAPSDWSTRLLMVSSPPLATSSSNNRNNSNAAEGELQPRKQGRRRDNSATANGNGSGGEPVRRCLHCAAEKTPQWRTGPMGPKTLCNACGVRFKSGRLVPEYRPSASPTFMSTKHSNSHRKVLELRRQKEMQRQSQQQQHFLGQNGAVFGMGSVAGGNDQYFIHHHMGPADHYRQMI